MKDWDTNSYRYIGIEHVSGQTNAVLGITTVGGAGSSLAFNIYNSWDFLYTFVRVSGSSLYSFFRTLSLTSMRLTTSQDDVIMSYVSSSSGSGQTSLQKRQVYYAG